MDDDQPLLGPMGSNKIGGTRCQISGLKYNTFYFDWGFSPEPNGETSSAPPDPLAVLNGFTPEGKKEGGKQKEEGQ